MPNEKVDVNERRISVMGAKTTENPLNTGNDANHLVEPDQLEGVLEAAACMLHKDDRPDVIALKRALTDEGIRALWQLKLMRIEDWVKLAVPMGLRGGRALRAVARAPAARADPCSGRR